jgi:hypothetical protein
MARILTKKGMQAIVVVALTAMVGFAIGDVMASCRGSACVAPWIWWRSMKDPDQAAWLQAIGTFLAIAVALVTPWVALWASRGGERDRAERIGVHLAIALTPVLGELDCRLRSVRKTIHAFVEGANNPLRWQWVPNMRIVELPRLAQLRSSFMDLGGLGFSLESINGTLQGVDAEINAMECLGPSVGLVPDLDDRLRAIDQVLESVSKHVASLRSRITEAANSRSLKPLMNPIGS